MIVGMIMNEVVKSVSSSGFFRWISLKNILPWDIFLLIIFNQSLALVYDIYCYPYVFQFLPWGSFLILHVQFEPSIGRSQIFNLPRLIPPGYLLGKFKYVFWIFPLSLSRLLHSKDKSVGILEIFLSFNTLFFYISLR